MPFRRDGAKASKWKHWLATHRDTLVRCGLPDYVLRDELHWYLFLEQGGWEQESGWNVQMLTRDQARTLRDFLAAEYGSDAYPSTLRAVGNVMASEDAV